MHRLDVGTTGLMVVAKSERAYTSLKRQFKERTVDKTYHTLVQGQMDPPRGTIDAPIDRHPQHEYRWAVVTDGKPSITHYETLEVFRHASLLEVHLETGRTHQIRVHMSAMRHPCAGDLTYGADPVLAKRLGAAAPVAARGPPRVRPPRAAGSGSSSPRRTPPTCSARWRSSAPADVASPAARSAAGDVGAVSGWIRAWTSRALLP